MSVDGVTGEQSLFRPSQHNVEGSDEKRRADSGPYLRFAQYGSVGSNLDITDLDQFTSPRQSETIDGGTGLLRFQTIINVSIWLCRCLRRTSGSPP